MFSLPDIKALNARAKSCATAFDIESKPRKKSTAKYPCECCGEKSIHHEKWYDIFSDDAKGVRHLCEECDDSGRGQEGWFHCDCCGRLMAENYTWEYYRTTDEETGETMCLTCAAKRYFSNPDNAINPSKVVKVVQGDKDAPLWDADSGIVNLSKVRHVLGVKQPEPEGIEYVDNFENCNERGLFDTDEIMKVIKEQDSPVFIVLDGAYQFSISIGLYVKE